MTSHPGSISLREPALVVPTDRAGDEQGLLARAWDQAARGYEDYFVPRFAPWVRDAVEALPKDLPDGAVVVPCCGTGPELLSLAARFPDRPLLGIDLSSGMVAGAAERTRHLPHVTLQVGDASDVTTWPPCAAVVSLFGLQQLPDPVAAVSRWTQALVAGGVLSVVFWPAIVETAGPFAWFRAAVLRRLPQPGSAWEDDLADAIRQAGGRLHDDSELGHPMQHESRECFFDAVINSGPGRVLLARHGAAWVDSLRQDFLSAAPRGPLVHTPTARHLLARR